MKKHIGKRVLITCSNWFYGPDGKQYRGVCGILHGISISQEQLGFTPSRTHTNWAIEIGDMTIMGCQVLYVVECLVPPADRVVDDYKNPEGHYVQQERATHIYVCPANATIKLQDYDTHHGHPETGNPHDL